MTYCVAVAVDRGLVLASDSRTNAGVDQVSTYSKMHELLSDGERMITVLTSGNLATTQAVVRQLRRDLEQDHKPSLKTVGHLAEAAEYIGKLSLSEQRKHRGKQDSDFNPEASFIIAGQIASRPPQIYLVYSEGNYIRASKQTPFLQIGELKYGKPILDRIIEADLPLDDVARCLLVSMDATMRSNVTVGPPIELMMYASDSLGPGTRYSLDEDDAYLRELRHAWQERLRQAFEALPPLPKREGPMRLVDARGDQ